MSTLKSRVEKLELQADVANLTAPRWQVLRAWRENYPPSFGDDNLFLTLLTLMDYWHELDAETFAQEHGAALQAAWSLYSDFATAQGWLNKHTLQAEKESV